MLFLPPTASKTCEVKHGLTVMQTVSNSTTIKNINKIAQKRLRCHKENNRKVALP